MIRFIRDPQPPYTQLKQGMVRDLGSALNAQFLAFGDAVEFAQSDLVYPAPRELFASAEDRSDPRRGISAAEAAALQALVGDANLTFTPETYGGAVGGSDATAAIQAAIDAASAAYNATTKVRATVVTAPGIYGISGLLLKPNVILVFGQSLFKKLVNGTTIATNSMLRCVDSLVGGSTYYGNYDNITISGGTFDTNGFTSPANILRFENVRDFEIKGTKVIHTTGLNWATQIGGQRILIEDVQVLAGTQVFQDGLHITHGDRITVRGCYIECGDDAIALGTDSTAATETWDNEALTNVTIDGVQVKSERGCLKIYKGMNTARGMPLAGIRGNIDGVVIRGVVGTLGRLRNGPIYIQDTSQITFTGTVASGATSATLVAAWEFATGVYGVLFSNGDIRHVTLTTGATTATWGLATASGASTAGATCSDSSGIKNVQIVDFDITGGSAANDGVSSYGLVVRFASNVTIRGTLRIVDTALGSKFFLGDCIQVLGATITLNVPAVPAAAGLQIRESTDVSIINGRYSGGSANRGIIEVTGSLNTTIHNNRFAGIVTSGFGIYVVSVGTGNYSNTLTITNNTFTKANGASATRAYVQGGATSGFVTYCNFSFNDIRGQSNATAVDAPWNTSNSIPNVADTFVVLGNRGGVFNAPGNVFSETNTPVTYTASFTPSMNSGTRQTMTLTGNTTVNVPILPSTGGVLTLAFTQDATGMRTVTWNAVFKFYSAAWVDALAGSVATSITFKYDGANWIQQAPNRWA